MRTFILRARKGPTTTDRVRPNVGGPSHVEVISQTLIAAMFVAKNVRDDVLLHVCLDGPSDPPKTLSFSSPDRSFSCSLDVSRVSSRSLILS